MPIYEYSCRKCGYVFDIFTHSKVNSNPSCPKCGDSDTNKIISPLGYLKHPDDSGSGRITPGGTCGSGECSGGCKE
ncbi:MAG TPA: zinc ribbon domain-containing protein [Caldisericia bacterium]|nr:zinc ribbon domain-containing protein [Caldisericia bacterium]